jgi:hypothetical protein
VSSGRSSLGPDGDGHHGGNGEEKLRGGGGGDAVMRCSGAVSSRRCLRVAMTRRSPCGTGEEELGGSTVGEEVGSMVVGSIVEEGIGRMSRCLIYCMVMHVGLWVSPFGMSSWKFHLGCPVGDSLKIKEFIQGSDDSVKILKLESSLTKENRLLFMKSSL